MKVLVVDDDPQITRALRINLRARGYEVDLASDGEQALRSAAENPPDVVVLDLGLPGISGMEVIEGLRGWTRVPILVVSGRAGGSDKVAALDAGADDYVTKPFGLEELLARLRALARRSVSAAPERARVRVGELTLDLGTQQVRRDSDGSFVHLTPTEWALLRELARNPGSLLSQRHLLTEVWGPGYVDQPANLRLYMTQLRRKLEPEPSHPRYLLTEPGMGYRFLPEDG